MRFRVLFTFLLFSAPVFAVCGTNGTSIAQEIDPFEHAVAAQHYWWVASDDACTVYTWQLEKSTMFANYFLIDLTAGRYYVRFVLEVNPDEDFDLELLTYEHARFKTSQNPAGEDEMIEASLLPAKYYIKADPDPVGGTFETSTYKLIILTAENESYLEAITGKSDGAACMYNLQCTSGFCVHEICRPSKPFCSDDFCDAGEDRVCLQDCGNEINETCSVDLDCKSSHCVHGICRAEPVFCGDEYCDAGENLTGTVYNCPADCGYQIGENCTANSDCLSDFCVHSVCRANSTFCGDAYCDSQENCSADCEKASGVECHADDECSSDLCVHDVCRPTDPYCGDHFCDSGEPQTCPSDCLAAQEGNVITIDIAADGSFAEKINYAAGIGETDLGNIVSWTDVEKINIVTNADAEFRIEYTGDATYLGSNKAVLESSTKISQILNWFAIRDVVVANSAMLNNTLVVTGNGTAVLPIWADSISNTGEINSTSVLGLTEIGSSLNKTDNNITIIKPFSKQYKLKIKSAAGSAAGYDRTDGDYAVWDVAPDSVEIGPAAIGGGTLILIIAVVIVVAVVFLILIILLLRRRPKVYI